MFTKFNSLVRDFGSYEDYDSIFYKLICFNEFKLPILLSEKDYSYGELSFMYKSSLEFQAFIEQYMGNSIYRLSQRNTHKKYITLELCGFVQLVRKNDISDIPNSSNNVLLLEMENYFTNIQYIAKTHKLSEYINECITRKD